MIQKAMSQVQGRRQQVDKQNKATVPQLLRLKMPFVDKTEQRMMIPVATELKGDRTDSKRIARRSGGGLLLPKLDQVAAHTQHSGLGASDFSQKDHRATEVIALFSKQPFPRCQRFRSFVFSTPTDDFFLNIDLLYIQAVWPSKMSNQLPKSIFFRDINAATRAQYASMKLIDPQEEGARWRSQYRSLYNKTGDSNFLDASKKPPDFVMQQTWNMNAVHFLILGQEDMTYEAAVIVARACQNLWFETPINEKPGIALDAEPEYLEVQPKHILQLGRLLRAGVLDDTAASSQAEEIQYLSNAQQIQLVRKAYKSAEDGFGPEGPLLPNFYGMARRRLISAENTKKLQDGVEALVKAQLDEFMGTLPMDYDPKTQESCRDSVQAAMILCLEDNEDMNHYAKWEDIMDIYTLATEAAAAKIMEKLKQQRPGGANGISLDALNEKLAQIVEEFSTVDDKHFEALGAFKAFNNKRKTTEVKLNGEVEALKKEVSEAQEEEKRFQAQCEAVVTRLADTLENCKSKARSARERADSFDKKRKQEIEQLENDNEEHERQLSVIRYRMEALSVEQNNLERDKKAFTRDVERRHQM
ncbi:hypothetical protein B0H63DRAFT_453569 [Podospora didyma]|uniref:Uncharacterized protein n=1 Tax=Podospora didyma TaxID=330526 RepID=A0AAE0N6R7_9PEZI|nr:hypothetical protein B0H63DRAFT_453569 [Podospora didyma]